ncbi:MAG: hypothetical protein H8E55_55825 [Pelagibacterales bacterium]|nr:hypothetical protein [Pelagibacterales bacterium]
MIKVKKCELIKTAKPGDYFSNYNNPYKARKVENIRHEIGYSVLSYESKHGLSFLYSYMLEDFDTPMYVFTESEIIVECL